MRLDRPSSRTLLLVWLTLTTGSCGEAPAGSMGDGSASAEEGEPWFEEVALERGLRFDQSTGQRDRFLYPEVACGGGALFDMDGDGDLDAYLVQSDGVVTPRAARRGNGLFRNDGRGYFEDISAGSGADDRGYGMGVATGDYDADGDLDLYVTNLGENALLRNEGDGTFVDVTEETGASEPLWSSSASFLDYDRDGDLDLWVVNYIVWSVETERVCYAQPHGATYCGPKAYSQAVPDTLFRNDGDGTFTNVSVDLGLRASLGNGLGIGVSDFNGDGWLDVFVANDGTKDQLWINREGQGFDDKSVVFGCAADQDGNIKAGMGVAISDLDEDGLEDLLVVNLTGEYDSLFMNRGTHFVDRTASSGLASRGQSFTRFGVGFHDFDQDGWIDLYEANGRVSHAASWEGDDPFAETNLLYRGAEGGRFQEVLPVGGTRPPLLGTSRAACFGDVDGDGSVDVLVINRDGPTHLLLNRAASGNWIRFRVLDGKSDALGATVSLRMGERKLMRRVRTSSSYCAANDARIHLGLGSASGVEAIRVRWSDGSEESFGARTAGQDWELVRGEGTSE